VTGLPAATSVVVARTVKPGRELDYERWLARAIGGAREFPGHLGADVLRPAAGGRLYVLIFRFDSRTHLDAWESSPVRAALVAEAALLSEPDVQVHQHSGLETWFTLPGTPPAAPPPRWKMALVTWSVAFPLVQGLTLLLGPWLQPLPPVARGALVAALMVASLTWVIMPRVTRALSRWLYAP
jgi:antibiotic biosynthesis monooxygenase (ABM) superfamily enzyme